ncbi:Ubiquitin carboxyl-terminal hydrolase 15, partial [Quaeritorhiza haematococci]
MSVKKKRRSASNASTASRNNTAGTTIHSTTSSQPPTKHGSPAQPQFPPQPTKGVKFDLSKNEKITFNTSDSPQAVQLKRRSPPPTSPPRTVAGEDAKSKSPSSTSPQTPSSPPPALKSALNSTKSAQHAASAAESISTPASVSALVASSSESTTTNATAAVKTYGRKKKKSRQPSTPSQEAVIGESHNHTEEDKPANNTTLTPGAGEGTEGSKKKKKKKKKKHSGSAAEAKSLTETPAAATTTSTTEDEASADTWKPQERQNGGADDQDKKMRAILQYVEQRQQETLQLQVQEILQKQRQQQKQGTQQRSGAAAGGSGGKLPNIDPSSQLADLLEALEKNPFGSPDALKASMEKAVGSNGGRDRAAQRKPSTSVDRDRKGDNEDDKERKLKPNGPVKRDSKLDFEEEHDLSDVKEFAASLREAAAAKPTSVSVHSPASPVSKSTPTPVHPQQQRQQVPQIQFPRYDYYQTSNGVCVSIYSKNVKEGDVRVDFTEQNVVVHLLHAPTPAAPSIAFVLPFQLAYKIDPVTSTSRIVKGIKVELNLKKEKAGVMWNQLGVVVPKVEEVDQTKITEEEQKKEEQGAKDMQTQVEVQTQTETAEAVVEEFRKLQVAGSQLKAKISAVVSAPVALEEDASAAADNYDVSKVSALTDASEAADVIHEQDDDQTDAHESDDGSADVKETNVFVAEDLVHDQEEEGTLRDGSDEDDVDMHDGVEMVDDVSGEAIEGGRITYYGQKDEGLWQWRDDQEERKGKAEILEEEENIEAMDQVDDANNTNDNMEDVVETVQTATHVDVDVDVDVEDDVAEPSFPLAMVEEIEDIEEQIVPRWSSSSPSTTNAASLSSQLSSPKSVSVDDEESSSTRAMPTSQPPNATKGHVRRSRFIPFYQRGLDPELLELDDSDDEDGELGDVEVDERLRLRMRRTGHGGSYSADSEVAGGRHHSKAPVGDSGLSSGDTSSSSIMFDDDLEDDDEEAAALHEAAAKSALGFAVEGDGFESGTVSRGSTATTASAIESGFDDLHDVIGEEGYSGSVSASASVSGSGSSTPAYNHLRLADVYEHLGRMRDADIEDDNLDVEPGSVEAQFRQYQRELRQRHREAELMRMHLMQQQQLHAHMQRERMQQDWRVSDDEEVFGVPEGMAVAEGPVADVEVGRTRVRTRGRDGKELSDEEEQQANRLATMSEQAREYMMARMERGEKLVGLFNKGTTCFINNIIQCLASIPQFVRYFLAKVIIAAVHVFSCDLSSINMPHKHLKDNSYVHDINTENPLSNSKGEVAKVFARLMGQLAGCEGDFGAFLPNAFLRALNRYSSLFDVYQQHDSEEFLRWLLDAIHEDVNKILKKPYIELPDYDDTVADEVIAKDFWDAHVKRNDSIIVDEFYGQYKSKITCKDCGKTSIKFDPYMNLTVELPNLPMDVQLVVVYSNLRKEQCRFNFMPTTPLITVKEAVMEATGIPPKRLAATIVIQSVIQRYLDDNELLCNLHGLATNMCFFELESELDGPEPAAFISASHQLREEYPRALARHYQHVNGANGGLADPAMPLMYEQQVAYRAFGFPMILTVRPRAYTRRELYMTILQRMGRTLTVDAAKLMASSTPIFRLKIISDSQNRDEEDNDDGANDRDDDIIVLNPSEAKTIRLRWHEQKLKAAFFNEADDAHMELGHQDPETPRFVTLQECLRLHMKEEEVDEWYCPRCKRHTHGIKKLDLWSLPEVLIVHLKRFVQHPNMPGIWSKRDVPVDFEPVDFDLGEFVLGGRQEKGVKVVKGANGINGVNGHHLDEGEAGTEKKQEKEEDDEQQQVPDADRPGDDELDAAVPETNADDVADQEVMDVEQEQTERETAVVIANGKEDVDKAQARRKSSKYDLFAISNHFGSLNSGHYTAYCKRGDRWLHFDDDKVSRVDDPNDLRQ